MVICNEKEEKVHGQIRIMPYQNFLQNLWTGIQDIFFGFLVELYSESVRKRQVNPRKFYLIDQGMHNYLTLNFSGNMGRVLENLIFLELRTKADSIWYYKTRGKYKVDFLMQDSGENHLIQVCYDLRNINTFSREALLLAMKELGIKTT